MAHFFAFIGHSVHLDGLEDNCDFEKHPLRSMLVFGHHE